MVRNANKLSAFRTDPVCFSFRSLFELAEVIFSSKSLKKSSIKMFPFNFQLSDDFCEVFGRKSRIGFSVAMSNGRFLCLFKHLSEVLITKSNLLWFSWPLFDFAEIFTSWSWIVKEKILRLGCVIAFMRKWYYRYKVNFFKRFFWNACLQREFVIQDFYLPRREKYPEKVIWMTFQTNIKLYLFQKEFSVKKRIFDERYALNFFPRNGGGWERVKVARNSVQH